LPLSADPIDSRVVDVETGAPIEGAVVLAYWELHPGSLSGDARPCGAANVEDTVTDKDGNFHLPGWGPTMAACRGEMRQGNPHLTVFKPGYYFIDVPTGIPDTKSVLSTGPWRDGPLPLKVIHDDDPRKQAVSEIRDLDSLETSMTDFIERMPAQCNWKKMPNMLRALVLQRQAIKKIGYGLLGMTDMLIANDKWYQQQAPQCGSPKVFIEELTKNVPQSKLTSVAQ
jgi:hypothetical protein